MSCKQWQPASGHGILSQKRSLDEVTLSECHTSCQVADFQVTSKASFYHLASSSSSSSFQHTARILSSHLFLFSFTRWHLCGTMVLYLLGRESLKDVFARHVRNRICSLFRRGRSFPNSAGCQRLDALISHWLKNRLSIFDVISFRRVCPKFVDAKCTLCVFAVQISGGKAMHVLHAMKTYWWGGSTAPLIINLITGWSKCSASRPG